MKKYPALVFASLLAIFAGAPAWAATNAGDFSGGVAIGTGYAGIVAVPPDGLIVEGSTGIGTTSPDNTLTVNGVIESLTGGIKFPDGTTQTTAASGGGGIGVDQTWTDETSNRALGTSYTNTTGKPIMISVFTALNNDSIFALTVGSVSNVSEVYNSTGNVMGASAVAIVPSGTAYSANVTTGSAHGSFTWMELR